MRYLLATIIVFGIATSSYSFQKSAAPSKKITTGITGQVYSVGGPAVRIDWTPPPLEKICTIVVTDSAETAVKETTTNSKGRFAISLPPGTYYLTVKESFIARKEGPFKVRKHRVTLVKASWDNGAR